MRSRQSTSTSPAPAGLLCTPSKRTHSDTSDYGLGDGDDDLPRHRKAARIDTPSLDLRESPRSPVEDPNFHRFEARQQETVPSPKLLESPRSPLEEIKGRPLETSHALVPHDDSLEDAIKRGRQRFERTRGPVEEESPRSPIEEIDLTQDTTDSPPSQPLPTPAATPARARQLHDIPEPSSRYKPQASTTDETVMYRDPHQFSLKPPYWKRWTPKMYSTFADELRAQFDATVFAKQLGRPVEEIQHVFNAVVCNPLYDAKKAQRRGEKGMVETFLQVNDHGTPVRKWSDKPNDEKIEGELKKVTGDGKVELILKDGNEMVMDVKSMHKDDVAYLKSAVSESEYETLRRAGGQEMEQIFALVDKTGTQMREWGRKSGKTIRAEFNTLVGDGEVQLLLEDGSAMDMHAKSMSKDDATYLKRIISGKEYEELKEASKQ